ncbi:hypothetical protein CDAR_62811 [Caerostris darwini]|uniref:Uncharacterized protein n=1 Tax=Caerostris darwini TaxID=1538125 RepID=A0AAV4UFV5_9ARAC|nr:hypothetical protein CDAR_62811 [Caerostris darwini]
MCSSQRETERGIEYGGREDIPPLFFDCLISSHAMFLQHGQPISTKKSKSQALSPFFELKICRNSQSSTNCCLIRFSEETPQKLICNCREEIWKLSGIPFITLTLGQTPMTEGSNAMPIKGGSLLTSETMGE